MNETSLHKLPTRVITAMALAGMALYPWLPGLMPIHFDRWGHPDVWVPKLLGAFVMPLFAIVLIDGVRLLDRLSPEGFEVGRFQDAWDATLTCLAAFLGLVHALILGSSLGLTLAVHRVIPMSIGLLVTALGFYLPKFKRNWWAGIRTPWSLGSEEAWNETHRRAGPLWVAGGLVLAGTGLVAANFPWLWVLCWIGFIGSTMRVSWECRRA